MKRNDILHKHLNNMYTILNRLEQSYLVHQNDLNTCEKTTIDINSI